MEKHTLDIILYPWDIIIEKNLYDNYCILIKREMYLQDFKEEDSFDYIRRIIKHELTHAVLSELGQSQNQFSNGRVEDSYDSEFICEFIAIYGNYIEKLTQEVHNFVEERGE